MTTTRRLEIRPYTLRDYRTWLNAYTTMEPPQSLFDEAHSPPKQLNYNFFRARVKRNRQLREADKAYCFGVFLKKTGALIGTTNLIVVFRIDLQTAFIGYEIFNRYWRNGYGREAVEATLDCGFRDVKLHRIEAGIAPSNKPSIALVKSLGMRKEGLQKHYCYDQDTWGDLISYALTAEDRGIEYGAPKIRAKFCIENL